MADYEKNQNIYTAPAVDAASEPPTKSTWAQRLMGRTNDPNVLGRELLQSALEFDEATLERDAIKVRRKLDFIVVPLMMTTYMLSFLDKQTYVTWYCACERVELI
jgi:hypothetical protein